MNNAHAWRLAALYFLLLICIINIFAGLNLVLIKDAPTKAKELYQIGNAYLETGETAAAQNAYREALKLTPLNAQYWQRLEDQNAQSIAERLETQ